MLFYQKMVKIYLYHKKIEKKKTLIKMIAFFIIVLSIKKVNCSCKKKKYLFYL
jgi:hypothetical protein